jgi:hypothetical protein
MNLISNCTFVLCLPQLLPEVIFKFDLGFLVGLFMCPADTNANTVRL